MQFKVLATLLFATVALASPAPKQEEKGFQVVIEYVDAPDCDYACGVNTTSSTSKESTTTITSTNTKYVIVTLQTNYGSTETVGCSTATTAPTDYYATSSSSAAPTDYATTSAAPVPTY